MQHTSYPTGDHGVPAANAERPAQAGLTGKRLKASF